MNSNNKGLKENGLVPAWLAEKLDKPYVIVDAYIQNCKQPLIEILYEIASILKVDPKELINSNIK